MGFCLPTHGCQCSRAVKWAVVLLQLQNCLINAASPLANEKVSEEEFGHAKR